MTPVRSPSGETPATWLARLERCFVHERGRRHGLLERFPVIFGQDAGAELWFLEDEGEAIGGLITVPRAIETAAGTLKPWTVGLVHVAPAVQGKGHGLRLLRNLEKQARLENVPALLLWARDATLYERAGYRTVGSARIGDYQVSTARGVSEPAAGIDIVPASEGTERMRRIAERHGFARHRTPLGWLSMPLSADHVVCIVGGGGYALAGVSRDRKTGYLYEMVGATTAFADLWACLGRIAACWIINAGATDPAGAWMSEKPDIRWRPNRIARSLILQPEAFQPDPRVFDLPYLDWI